MMLSTAELPSVIGGTTSGAVYIQIAMAGDRQGAERVLGHADGVPVCRTIAYWLMASVNMASSSSSFGGVL